MGLKKSIEYKGINADYLCITNDQEDKIRNITTVVLSLYTSIESRLLSLTNSLQSYPFNFTGIGFDYSELYGMIIESKPEISVIQEATEDTEAITETIETNPFADATNV